MAAASWHAEGLLQGALIAARLFSLAVKLVPAGEEDLVHSVRDAFQHLRDVVATVLLHQAAHGVHVH